MQPTAKRVWQETVRRGDDALAARQYQVAIYQYQKLRWLKLRSGEPNHYLGRVQAAEQDILTLRDFYTERGDTAMLALIQQATATYQTPDEATTACQTLLRRGELSLANICITRTTAAWPKYRDAWLTESVIAKASGQNDQAAASLQKAKELDPESSLETNDMVQIKK